MEYTERTNGQLEMDIAKVESENVNSHETMWKEIERLEARIAKLEGKE